MRKFLKQVPVGRQDAKFERSESNFTNVIWPLMETHRIKERSLVSIERLQFGRHVQAWQMR